MHKLRWRSRPVSPLAGAAIAGMMLLLSPALSQAGCGCTKPAPAPAALRPHVSYPGNEITIFDARLVEGAKYRVELSSTTADASAKVSARAVRRRDVATGEPAVQLALALPDLPLGPTSVSVSDGQGNPLFTVSDSALTVVNAPLALPEESGRRTFSGFRAAVGRDGAAYIALDFSAIGQARLFRAQALDLPMRFGSDDLAFFNRQGYLMQLLGEDMPGLYAIQHVGSRSSDVLVYSRHEFNTHFLQHEERQVHAIDADDPNWHADGTPHIDHDYQILQIAGHMADGSAPEAGSTPPFDLVVDVYSLFHGGVGADRRVSLAGGSRVESFDSSSGHIGFRGQVTSLGDVEVKGGSVVFGGVAAHRIEIEPGSLVTGDVEDLDRDFVMLPVDVPTGLVDLGELEVHEGTRVLGTGSYLASKVAVSRGAQLFIDNAKGPVTLYVTGDVEIEGGNGIDVEDDDPERLAFHLAGESEFSIEDGSAFYGVVYGPGARIEVKGGSLFEGAVVGAEVEIDGGSIVRFDETLRADGPSLHLASSELEDHENTANQAFMGDVSILRAVYQASRIDRPARVVVSAVSTNPGVELFVTIDGAASDQPMTWSEPRQRFEFRAEYAANLDGRGVTVRGSDGSFARAVLK